jgi:hypothetical protein
MPSNLNAELARQMAVKSALVSTTNTTGWPLVKEIADRVVNKAIQEALDEEDSDRGESKRLKASALKKGFADLFNYIDSVKQYDPQAANDGGLQQLEYTASEFEAIQR